uniref:Uncharacterized protein n=3 Tax=Avena sativa TaxID=4498 RepID=A0ACD5UM05_AVESA
MAMRNPLTYRADQGHMKCAFPLNDLGEKLKQIDNIAFQSKKNVAAKLECLKKTIVWSDAQSSSSLRLGWSQGTIPQAGNAQLCPGEPAQARELHCQVSEGKNGLLKCHQCCYNAVEVTEVAFVEKFIDPHKEVVPHRAEDYAAACRGEMSIRFKFQQDIKCPLGLFEKNLSAHSVIWQVLFLLS